MEKGWQQGLLVNRASPPTIAEPECLRQSRDFDIRPDGKTEVG